MAKRKENINLATKILSDMKRRLIRCKVALIILLAGNIIQAALWLFR